MSIPHGSRPRVLFVNRFFYPDHSATSQLLTDLASHLAEMGWDVHVVTSRQRYDDPSIHLASNELFHTVSIHRVWSFHFGRERLGGRALDYLSFYITAGLSMLRHVHRGTLLVAKTDPPLIGVLAMVAAKLRGAKLVNWVQDLFPETAQALGIKMMSGRLARGLQKVRDFSLRCGRLNVALGEKMAEKITSAGVPTENVRVIPNWSDGANVFPVEENKNPLRDEWGLRGKFVIGYSGNIGRAHEFATILAAAKDLRDDKNIVFLWIGGGAQKRWLESRFDELGLRNWLFKPYQPRSSLARSLSVADVHLVTLRPVLEGCVVPSKFYGVLAAGRPTIFIGAKNGELANVVENEGVGYVVEQGDSKALVDTLITLKNDLRLQAEIRTRSRKLFLDRYDRQTAVAAWASALEKVWIESLGSSVTMEPNDVKGSSLEKLDIH